MTRTDDLYKLPDDLPVPVDDGACDHLTGMRLPALSLRSTADEMVNLSQIQETVVIYCYPRTGEPDKDPTPGWNDIPGARGCTPQSCAFRDHYQELQAFDAAVYGLSTQTTDYQKELVRRLHLPFDVLSDADLKFTRAINLPTFTVQSMTLIKRLTLIAEDSIIRKVFYPVFPPHKNPDDVIAWLSQNSRS
ncbi:MAG: peroxiredoxin [Acidiferrobacterales bacterium]